MFEYMVLHSVCNSKLCAAWYQYECNNVLYFNDAIWWHVILVVGTISSIEFRAPLAQRHFLDDLLFYWFQETNFSCTLTQNNSFSSKTPLKCAVVAPIPLQCCTQYDNDTPVLCAKFQNDCTLATNNMDKPSFTKFEFTISFERVSRIAQGHRS